MALINPSLAGLCEAVLQELKNVNPLNYPAFMGKQNGLTDFLQSPLNVAGFEQAQIKTSNNSIRKVRVRNIQRLLSSDIITDRDAVDCNPNTTDKFFEDEVLVENWSGFKKTFTNDEMRQYCIDPQMFIREVLMSGFKTLRTQQNEQMLADVFAGKGVNVKNLVSDVPSSDCKAVTLLDQVGHVTIDGLNDMRIDYEDNQLSGTPVVIGDAVNFQKTWMNLGVGCCNDGGVDMNKVMQQIGMGYFKDQSGDSILGTDNVLMIAPGSVQKLEYLENDGAFFVQDGQGLNGIIVDPFTGERYDWDISYDNCISGKQWVMHVSKWYDTYITMGADSFADGDELKGVNGIFCYNTQRLP